MKAIGVALMLAVALLAGGTAQGAKKATYCEKAVKADRGKVDKKTGGITVWHRGQVISACTDRYRKSFGLLIVDKGVKVSLVRTASKRCMAILLTSKKGLPEILFKDLQGKEIGSSAVIVGYGSPAATVGSLAVSTNCVAAWGQSVSDGAGTTAYSIQAKGFGAATAVTTATHPIATVPAAGDIAHVGVKAAGKGATVSWTLAGARQTASLES